MINFERLIYMRQPFLRKVLTGILMRELSQRTSQFTDSVIRRMTRVANKYGAVNLSQGFPDFDPPEAITDRLAEVAGEGPHQYALTWGAKNFRDALAAKQEHFSGMKIDAESEIVVTCGSTEAMMAAMMSVVNPGDKVIIFSPFYENYGADTRIGLIASVIMGTTETIFYTITVYFGAVKIKKIRHTLWAAVFADIMAIIMAVLMVSILIK